MGNLLKLLLHTPTLFYFSDQILIRILPAAKMIDKPGINLTPIFLKLQLSNGYRKGF